MALMADSDYEPMDVDRSGSTNSKMDISYINDFDSSDSDNIIDITEVRSSPRVGSETIIVRDSISMSRSHAGSDDFSEITDNERPWLRAPRAPHFRSNIRPARRTILRTSPKENSFYTKKSKPCRINSAREDKEPYSNNKVILIGIFILFSLALYQLLTNFQCAEEMNLGKLELSFTNNLYGQTVAANKIIDTLKMKVSSKILFLYGGTGVGKTYTVSLMLEDLWNSTNIYHYTMPTFTDSFSPQLMYGLTLCKTSVLVVDGLNRNDIHIKPHIVNTISKSENLGKNITVILIYNCDNITKDFVKKCDKDFLTELEEHFIELKSVKQFIKFEPLSDKHLRKCVEKELGHRKVNDNEMNNILKNFDVSLDGCKGVYTKIKFLNVI